MVCLNLFILNPVESLEYMFICKQEVSHSHESLNDSDTDFYCLVAMKDCRKHCYTLLCIRIWEGVGMFERFKPVATCNQFIFFFFCQLKSE